MNRRRRGDDTEKSKMLQGKKLEEYVGTMIL
jgi:hypothetical protein